MALGKSSKSSKSGIAAKAAKTVFYCTACGNEQPRWFGHCTSCGEWNTASEAPPQGRSGAAPAHAAKAGRARWAAAAGNQSSGPMPLADVEMSRTERSRTGMRELDRVLGGGLVPGSLILVGGDPGKIKVRHEDFDT